MSMTVSSARQQDPFAQIDAMLSRARETAAAKAARAAAQPRPAVQQQMEAVPAASEADQAYGNVMQLLGNVQDAHTGLDASRVAALLEL